MRLELSYSSHGEPEYHHKIPSVGHSTRGGQHDGGPQTEPGRWMKLPDPGASGMFLRATPVSGYPTIDPQP
jgi:hypothetical protein